jgi:protein-disulfide isomerase
MTAKRIAVVMVVLALAAAGLWWLFSERGAAREVASAPAASVQPRPASPPPAEDPAPAVSTTTSTPPDPSTNPGPATTSTAAVKPTKQRTAPPVQQPSPPAPSPPPAAPDRCIGSNPDAPVTLEVFSDHQCPACRRFYLEVTRPLLADYAMKGKVCVVYHEFPLRQHQYSREAARYSRAAVAAGLSQEDWIRITDALYYYQPQWASDGKVDAVVANALTEDKMARLRKELGDPRVEAAIDHEIQLARQANVRATPTVRIIVNGSTESIPAGVQYPMLQRYLDNLLAQAR